VPRAQSAQARLPSCGGQAYATRRSADHFNLCCGAILQAIQDQLDAGGDAEFVEDAEEIIADDFLLAGGWTARRVAIGCYFLTAFLGLLGWFAMNGGIKRTVILGVGIFGVFVLSALWLGARRGAIKHSRYRVQI